MKKAMAAVRQIGPSAWEMVFIGGSTAVFLAIMASVAEAVLLYLR